MHLNVCKKCIMDNTSPDFHLNNIGVCNYCLSYEKNINHNLNYQKLENDLNKIIKKIKNSSKNKKYDCLLPISGGMDSSYVAYLLVKRFNLRPLLYHVDAGWNSNIAQNNIEKIIDKLNLDLITDVIDWDELKDLHLAYFKSGVPSLETVQDHAFFGSIYNYAEKNKFKWIVTGANHSTEFIRPPLEWSYHASDTRQIKDIHKKFGNLELKNFPFYDIFKSRIYLKIILGVKMFYPLNYIPYRKKDVSKILKNEFGWKEYSGKHNESIFTAFYQNYWTLKRFNHDRRKTTYSSLILSNQITREEASKLLEREPIDKLALKKEIKYVCDKLEITETELDYYFKLEKKSFKDYKSNYFLINFFTKILNLLNIEKRVF